MTIEEKLKHFLDTSVETANARSVKTIEEYQKGLDSVFDTYKADVLRKQALQSKFSEENLRKEKNTELSKRQMEIRRAVGEKQEELKQSLFREVEEKLESYRKTGDYNKYLVEWIKRAKDFAGKEEVQIYIDPIDKEKMTGLEIETKAKLTLSEYSFKGGMRAVIRSKNILIDQSFETKLNEIKKDFSFNFQ